MERLVAILGEEALKVLAKKYGKTEHEIMVAAVTGHPKIVADIKKLIHFAIENL